MLAPVALAVAAHRARASGDPLAFYQVTATVIPVLLLALIYQSRFLPTAPRAAQYVIGGLGAAFAVSGEVLSLRALVTGTAHYTQANVEASLAVLGAAVLIDPLILAGRGLIQASTGWGMWTARRVQRRLGKRENAARWERSFDSAERRSQTVVGEAIGVGGVIGVVLVTMLYTGAL